MDSASKDIAIFLEELQNAMTALRTHWNYFSERGALPHRPYLTMSARPVGVCTGGVEKLYRGSVALGLSVDGPSLKGVELGIDIMWDDDRWTISTEAWVEAEEGGQRLVRALAERTALDLATCVAEIKAAVNDLRSFEDVVFAEQ